MIKYIPLLVLCGCSDVDFSEYPYSCPDNVFTEVLFTKPTECGGVQAATDLAHRIFHDSGFWDDAKSPTVLVVWDDYVRVIRGIKCAGWTDAMLVVQLQPSLAPLLHELIHVHDIELFDFLSSTHDGWTESGRYGLVNFYVWELLNLPVVWGDNGPISPCNDPPIYGEDRLRAAGYGADLDARKAVVQKVCSQQ